jgi:ERCC4-related helicase
VFVEHPLIRENAVEEREYQAALAQAAVQTSTLIVLPTGMGKTVIALRVIAEVLLRRGGKVLFLAPTKPLVEQHACFLKDTLLKKKVAVMTGEIDPQERELLFLENEVIASTPQVVANDLRSERIDLRNVHLIIFDEAHRAVGDYSYVAVAQHYAQYNGLVLGMTASPGSSGERIKEVCQNLGIERIEVRTESDPDVAKYVHHIQMDEIEVELPAEIKRLVFLLRSLFDSYVKNLVRLGVMDGKKPPNRKYLLEVGGTIQARLKSGERHRNLYQALSQQAMAIKVDHGIELAESQGVSALREYLQRLRGEAESDEGSKAARTLIQAPELLQVEEMLRTTRIEHPKLSRAMTLVARQVNEKPESRIIVFTQYRDTCNLLTSKLSEIEGARVGKLVGQADRSGEKGLKQKEQVGVLELFRNGHYNVLVATSVGEEGLDVANTDLVVFYEPVPSEIRAIQRRGRTGRKRAGRVVVLLARGTRDEAYLYASLNKERRMKRGLSSLQKKMETEGAGAGERGESVEDAPGQPETAEQGAQKRQRRLFDYR